MYNIMDDQEGPSVHANIVLVTVCDDHFSIMVAALLKSIEVNYRSEETITIYLIDEDISERNKKKINDTLTKGKTTLIWIAIQDAIPPGTNLPLDNSLFPISVYARLCIPYFLPKQIKKVIYLDADTLVVDDIRKLWDVDIANHSVAAVIDRSETVDSAWAGIANYAELGIPAKSKYFNSGVMVIDVERWRIEDAPAAIFQCVEKNLRYASYPDQYGLNVYFANRWYELDPGWNSYSQSNLPNPYIIHFIGRKPIYREYRYNQNYRDQFYAYLALTPFQGFKPYSKGYRLGNKMVYLARKEMLRLGKAWKSIFRLSNRIPNNKG